MARKRAGGSNRLTIQLKDENYLAVMTATTPSDGSKPPFGVVSKFFNMLVEDWRARKAAATNQEQPQ